MQVTKVLLCAFQLIIISLITPPKTACTRSKCPISPSWYEHEHCLYTNMSMSMSMSMSTGTERRIVMRGAGVYFCVSELGGDWQVTPAPTPGSCWHPNIAEWGHCYCGQTRYYHVGYRDLVDIGKRALHLQISINNQNLPPARFVRFWQENWFIASAFLLRHMNLSRSMLPDISCTLVLYTYSKLH